MIVITIKGMVRVSNIILKKDRVRVHVAATSTANTTNDNLLICDQNIMTCSGKFNCKFIVSYFFVVVHNYSIFIYFIFTCSSNIHTHPPHCIGDDGEEHHGDDTVEQPSSQSLRHQGDQPRRRNDHHW